ncbi:heavy-metal-associated domain-containing protein [Clostridium polynesiense]|uniref:heavy-metal-associated domain-containing protein n=1 Tax=Clostridium polynesiense TaxID=1325933 RepID=UPI000590BA9F|nr:heavy-metal-associated domain-containing protein [Clostridium polynesiense]
MKSLLKVRNIKTYEDVIKIKEAIAEHEGVVACEINKEKGEISIVYDNYFVSEDEFIGSVEELGYTVL